MLVLASASPRRRELLTQVGFTFEVHPAHIPEDPLPGEDPTAYVTRLALEKAEAVFNQLIRECGVGGERAAWSQRARTAPQGLKPHDSIGAIGTAEVVPFCEAKKPARERDLLAAGDGRTVVLGADTTVVLGGHILAKPENEADAARMLRLLSGRTHRVITGVAVVTASGAQVASETTVVEFLPLTEEDIADYVATGEPMDKAGAYAIQGRAARWIPRIVGDYFNVVGLPLALVSSMLRKVTEQQQIF